MNPTHLKTEGYEYGYAMFEPLPDIHLDSSKHTPILHVGISSITATSESNAQNEILKMLKFTCHSTLSS